MNIKIVRIELAIAMTAFLGPAQLPRFEEKHPIHFAIVV
jgi:hypothetical protein